jgi:hypothetical protein
MAPIEYLRAWGTLIHEKNLKSKISCQTPFKVASEPYKIRLMLKRGYGRFAIHQDLPF